MTADIHESTAAAAPAAARATRRWAAWKAIVRWQEDRILPVERLLRKKGDIAGASILGQRYFFVNAPDLVQECLVTRHKEFQKDRYYRFLRLFLGEGLLTSEGDRHLRQRRMIQPAFHRERINGYALAMAHFSRGLADSWQDGQRVDIYRAMMALALDIVGKTLFNSDVSGAAGKVAEASEHVFSMDSFYLSPFGPILMKLPLPSVLRFWRGVRALDRILYRMIAEHRASGDQGDLLSMLLEAHDEDDGQGMDDRQIRDEAVTLFMAGHETTAIALTWTFYCLAQNPACEARLHAELDAVLGGRDPEPEDVPKLDYTRRVFAESMRLYPPAYMVGREALCDTALGATPVPKGSIVILSPYITQRDPALWPDPLRFDPERFAEANAAGRHKFAYFPFGGGRRLCIGEPFAWMEGVMVLATLCRRWRATLDPDHAMAFDPRITLRPKGGMPMTLERRG